MNNADEASNRNRDNDPKLPKLVVKDNAKWIFLPTKVILSSASLWPETNNLALNIVTYIVIISLLFFLYGSYYFTTHVHGNLLLIVLGVSFAIVEMELLARYFLIVSQKTRLQNLLNYIYYDLWSSNYAGAEVDQELLTFTWRMVIFISIYTASAGMCSFQYITNAVFYQHLPLYSAYPWNGSPYNEILLVYQSFLTVLTAFGICGIDWLFVCLMLIITAQFKLLKTYLKVNIEEAILQNGNSEQAYKILRHCIAHHLKILWACDKINTIFKYFILFQFLASMSSVCVSSFIMTTMPQERQCAVAYLIGHLSEIFIYCYVGSELSTESSSLSDAVFECGWHLGNTSNDFQKSLVMVMMRSQKPIRILAGGFGYLSLPKFLNLMQFSFSVFTLLRHVTEDKRIST